MKEILISAKKLSTFGNLLFQAAGVSRRFYGPVVKSLVETSLRGVDSHGIHLIPHYLKAVVLGRINKNPKFVLEKRGASVANLDADHAFGINAGIEAIKVSIKMAKKTGVGAVAVKNSSHFGAAATFGLLAAREDMLGMCFTQTAAQVIPFGGKRPFLGTNPICFCAPIEKEEPFCLDMATSQVAWNKILVYKASRKNLPEGWAADALGKPTVDWRKAVSLLPIGNYKGYGLALMVEILCSMLTGMNFGPHLKKMYPVDGKKRKLGHFFMAVDIGRFIKISVFKKRMRKLFDELRNEPSRSKNKPVLVPGDPEKIIYKERIKKGIPISKNDLETLEEIAKELNIKSLF